MNTRNFVRTFFHTALTITASKNRLFWLYYLRCYTVHDIFCLPCEKRKHLTECRTMLTVRSFLLYVATDKEKQPKWNVTLNNWWNWSSCTKLALSVSWTHGLIVELIRASERNSLVVGSNSTQMNFL